MKAFARRLEGLNNHLVSHFGEGLYAIVPKTQSGGNEIVNQLDKPLELSSINLDPQIVLGIVSEAQISDKLSMADELIRRAVTAMSAAQAKGKRWLTYTTSLEPDPTDLELLQDFNRYGTRDMFLLYQPKVNLKTGRINAAEALIRWQHPSLGLVSPARFILLLEQSRLIDQVTHWVIEEAVRMVIRNKLSDSDCSISVNMAPQDLLELKLVKFITQVTGQIKPHCLRLEITETGFMEDPVRARDVLTDLQNKGICCGVDDFGTGYSSLSYLSEFPVDEVKLDRKFVGDMLENDRHKAIVRSTISLAHELGLTVTAEGVEDVETIRALIDMDCDAAQGYVISRPVPEEELLLLFGRKIDSVIGETVYS